MKELIEGYQRFRSDVFHWQSELHESLVEGQKPPYLLITCCDSRVNPYDFTQSRMGDVFIERSIGNLVPAPGSGEHEAQAAIEYAVLALGVKHVIVCGHSQCGAMKGLLAPESLAGMPTVARWLEHAADTLEAVRSKYPQLQGDDLLDATIRENVLVQIEHIRQIPAIQAHLADGRLQLHGWVYEFATGNILVYVPHATSFIDLREAYADWIGAASG